MYIDIVVCHPMKDVVGEVLPGLILTEHDEEGEEGGQCRDRGDHDRGGGCQGYYGNMQYFLLVVSG